MCICMYIYIVCVRVCVCVCVSVSWYLGVPPAVQFNDTSKQPRLCASLSLLFGLCINSSSSSDVSICTFVLVKQAN